LGFIVGLVLNSCSEKLEMTYRFLVFCVVFTGLVGCATLPREPAVPAEQMTLAVVPGMGGIRYFEDNPADMARMKADIAALWPKQRAWLAAQGKKDAATPPSYMLAISGGGDNGAFGAGLLNGWTTTGLRPEFDLVTGISTGALIAPYAFLGSAHDGQLRELYTETSGQDLVIRRRFFGLLSYDSALDTSPLRAMIEKHIDRDFLDEIAAESQKGRVLLIATTNLDSRQRVIWNMTKIAASRDPRAIKLFQDVMLASASIPGAFPPVMIDVDVADEHFSEMHVDGGTSSQVFIYPPSIRLGGLARTHDAQRKRSIYIIMNEPMVQQWAETRRHIVEIVARSLATVVHNQGIGDLFRIYFTAMRDDIDFHVAYIPEGFSHPDPMVFNNAFMRALYACGYQEATQGSPWKNHPPGLGASSVEN
jgi:predicted patatin/cPLA2 family phospholipase